MHSPAARALLQPRALLHHPRVCTLKDLTLAGHVITITYIILYYIALNTFFFLLPIVTAIIILWCNTVQCFVVFFVVVVVVVLLFLFVLFVFVFWLVCL